MNDAATKLQAALGAKKPASLPASGASQPAATSGGLSTADKFKMLASQAKETNAVTAGGPVLVKVADQAPISVADVTKRLLDADRLVKSGVISTSPTASKVALDSFINAGVSGLVSAPINVGAYAGSVATGEAIKSQYTPTTLPPPHLPGAAKPPQAPVSAQAGAVAEVATPPAASTTRRLDRVEAAVLKFANVLLTLATGVAGDGVGKDENWPKERGARLTNLERLLDVSEQQMKQVAEDNGVLFKPYVVVQDISGKSGGRVGAIEQRYRAMEKAVDQIIILKEAEANGPEPLFKLFGTPAG